MRPSSDVVTVLLYKLSCQWSLAPETVAGKREELAKLVHEVGERRALAAIDGIIQNHKGEFCPPIGKIREYVPERQQRNWITDAEWEELKRQRAARPDDFFGEADVVCAMRIMTERIKNKQPLLSTEDLLRTVLEIRHSANEARR